MTGISSAYSYSATSAQLRLGVTSLESQESALETEMSTGVTSTTYAGLGDSRAKALSLDPAITQVSAWRSNVTTAQSRLTTTQTVLDQVSTIATNLTTSLATLDGTVDSSTVSTAVDEAKSALSTLTSLLNTQSGNSYIFAGQASDTAPVSTDLDDSSSGSLLSSIASAVDDLDSDGASSVLSTTLSLAGDTTAGEPFSSALSTDAVSASDQNLNIVVGNDYTVSAGIVATQGTAATDTSTGSPVRDLIRNLMVVASLGSVDTSGTGYTDLISGLQSSNTGVTDGITGLSTRLGIQQDELTNQSSVLTQMSTSLSDQLNTAKNADWAAVSTQLTDVKNQLEASYSVISDLKDMSLASYL